LFRRAFAIQAVSVELQNASGVNACYAKNSNHKQADCADCRLPPS